MALTVTTTVSGSVTLESGIELSLNFNIPKKDESLDINFSCISNSIIHITGTYRDNSIYVYYVNNGIVTEEIMEEIQDKITEIVDEYIEK